MTRQERELAYHQGYAAGFESGYDKGFNEGCALAYNDGFIAGLKEAFAETGATEPSTLLRKLVEAGLVKLVVSGPAEQDAKHLLYEMGLNAQTLLSG